LGQGREKKGQPRIPINVFRLKKEQWDSAPSKVTGTTAYGENRGQRKKKNLGCNAKIKKEKTTPVRRNEKKTSGTKGNDEEINHTTTGKNPRGKREMKTEGLKKKKTRGVKQSKAKMIKSSTVTRKRKRREEAA